MRIGMLLDNEFSGDMRVENEVLSLQEAGHQVYVICLNYGQKKTEEDFHGATIVRHTITLWRKNKMKGLTNTLLDFYSRYWAKLAVKAIEAYDLDVIHAHDLYLVKAGIMAKNRVKKKIKLVADLHENYPHALKYYKFSNTFPGNLIISIPKWERSEKKWLLHCDAIITVIEEAALRYEKLGIAQSKIWVVSNYINRKEFEQSKTEKLRGKYPDDFILLYTGGFDYHRGIDHIIEAIPSIAEKIPTVKLVLVGTGKNIGELKEQVSHLGITDKVIFEGWQLAKELPSYMNEADVCLIPHLKTEHTDNTIPHKLFHYMYMAKPVVVTNCDPIARIVNETSTGIVYESNNSEQFSEAIFSLYQDKTVAMTYAKNGEEAVATKYNWEHTSKNLIDLYQNLKSKSYV